MTSSELKARLRAANPKWAINISGPEGRFVTVMDGDLTITFDTYNGLTVNGVPPQRALAVLHAALGLEAAQRVPVREGAWSATERAAFDAAMNAPISERHRALEEAVRHDA